MGTALDRFAAQCREILYKDPGPAGREKVKAALEAELQKGELAAQEFGPDNKEPRKILYKDEKLGFCILSHVHEGEKHSDPHDHGPSWAIYGQAEGVTEMRDWQKLAPPRDGKPGTVKEVRKYELRPGQARVYNEGDLHSPARYGATKLIRMEGMNMDGVKRDKYVVAETATAAE